MLGGASSRVIPPVPKLIPSFSILLAVYIGGVFTGAKSIPLSLVHRVTLFPLSCRNTCWGTADCGRCHTGGCIPDYLRWCGTQRGVDAHTGTSEDMTCHVFVESNDRQAWLFFSCIHVRQKNDAEGAITRTGYRQHPAVGVWVHRYLPAAEVCALKSQTSPRRTAE